MEHRLQKLLAQANYGSRRAAEDLITAGRVRVNGEVAQLGSKADPDKDVVTVDGQRVDLKSPPIYLAYNKPINVVSATERQPGDDRPTVRDMVPVDGHLFLLGRLDAESEGLVVLTNDGDLTQALTHPRYEHTKTYQVVVYGSMDGRTADRWARGVTLDEEDGTTVETAQCFVDIVRREGDVTILKVVMTEGRNRQIRRVAALLGHPVKRLVRTHIGRYAMADLPRGEYVELKERDVKLLKTAAPELDEIRKIKGQENAAKRRQKLMAHSTASEEQIEEAKRNRLPPAPRRGKKYAARDAEREERTRRDDRPRRPGSSDRRGGPRDGRRVGPKPQAFRSRLMIDESGENTPGARRHRGDDIPEGFRSRNAEQDLPEGFRARLSEADRPTRRVFRREGDSRGGESRGGRGPRREGGYRSRDGESRSGEGRGEGRPPRREGGYRSRDGESRGGEGRGEGRPPRREGGYRSRDGESRGGEGRGEGRPPRREGGYRSRDGESRGGEGRGEGRPPRREGGYRSRDGESRGGEGRGEGRPPRREGGYRS
ncbi:MAG: rRNA pseudouridine synthase [Chloroflexi bacterium]|nr:rRNA pseudouridine synthase [Chloroflexota bacterium]